VTGDDDAPGYACPDPLEFGRMGIDAAADVIDRLLEFGRTGSLRATPLGGRWSSTSWRDGAGSADPEDPAGESKRESKAEQLRRLRADADRIVELSADVTRLLIDTTLGMAEDAVGDRASAVAAVLGPVASGSSTHTTVWLHVLDGPSSGTARLHCSPLVHHTGAVLPPDVVTFAPGSVDTAFLRTSIRVEVTATVPDGTAPGLYHGVVQAIGLPEVALPLRVEVADP
jgi:hypothetical protein